MKKISFILSIVRNKYLLSAMVFGVWILFFDRNDLVTQWDRKKELQKLETSKAYYETQIKSTQKELADLDRDTRVLEKFAREKFFLKRSNEDVFVITDSIEVKN